MPLTVLFVDDDVDLLESVQDAASATPDLRIITAGSAKEALRTIEEEPVDVVVTDENMNEMTGLNLLAEVHRRSPGLRLVLISGLVTDAMRDHAGRLGVESIMSKPFRFGDLMGLLAKRTNGPPSR